MPTAKFPSADWLRDAVYRVIMTVLEAAGGVLAAAVITDIDTAKATVAAMVAVGAAAGIASAKTIVAGLLNGTAALVPPPTTTVVTGSR